MTLDIRGGLKNTSISGNRYVVIEELLSNAIDSYLIRKNEDPARIIHQKKISLSRNL